MEIKRIAIFLPISRKWRINKMLEQIVELEVPEDTTVEIVILLDNISISKESIIAKLKKLGNTKEILEVYNTFNQGTAEGNVARRRQRIAEVFNKAKKFIPDSTDLVFGIEDDTDISKDALVTLVGNYNHISKAYPVGIISGVQVGRWGFRMIGAWMFDNIENPTTAETMPFKSSDDQYPVMQNVDAVGFYCFIVPAHLFKEIEFRAGDFGPDVYFGLDVRRQGFQNFVNWNVIAGHATKRAVLVPQPDCVVVKYELHNKKWIRTLPKAKS